MDEIIDLGCPEFTQSTSTWPTVLKYPLLKSF